MDNNCKCGTPSPSRAACADIAADLAADLAAPSADLLVKVYAGAVARLARLLAGDCRECVFGAINRAVA